MLFEILTTVSKTNPSKTIAPEVRVRLYVDSLCVVSEGMVHITRINF